jgi:hypothetical protein
MTQVTVITTAPDSILDQARGNLVGAAKKTGDVIANYAAVLCEVFNVKSTTGETLTPWYELKGKAKAPLKLERERFVNAFIAEGFEEATITVYWQRVKKAAGYVPTGNRVKGVKTPDDLNLTELKTIINRIFKTEETSETPWSDEKAMLMDIYSRMGGEVDNLG